MKLLRWIGLLLILWLGLGDTASAMTTVAGPDGALRDCGFFMARVWFDNNKTDPKPWNIYPGADRNALEELDAAMRCRVHLPPGAANLEPRLGNDTLFNAVVDLYSVRALREYPIIFMTSDRCFELDPQQKANLKQYLEQGGFLLMDDCVCASAVDECTCKECEPDEFYRCAYAMLEELFGMGAVEPLPLEHEVFHNVYDLSATGLPHLQGLNYGGQGVHIDGRLAVFLSSTDIHCGWADRERSEFTGRHGYDEAVQMAVNLFMYAMTH
jgi:hypothetical protein